MSKVYIFGDSFLSAESRGSFSWALKLAGKYEVVNTAQGGISNHEIFLRFLKYVDLFTESDSIIIGWSDPSRYYVIPGVTKSESTFRTYYTHFYNKELDLFHQLSYMQEIKRLIKKHNLQVLFMWSFPTDYKGIETDNPNWLDAIASDLPADNYSYQDTFENEIKPALLYFSKKDVRHFKSQKEITKYFIKDSRPNHISDQRVHEELYNIASQFIEKQLDGHIDLVKRLEDGS